MGQYYKPVNTEDLEWVYSHDYGQGLKLMEHSWIGNKFVGSVMRLLTKDNRWYKKPLVWCGDYYGEKNTDEVGYYDKTRDDNKVFTEDSMSEAEQLCSVIVNHTKKEYVLLLDEKDEDKKKSLLLLNVIEENEFEWIINPLPLLCALGNGRGGGDYHGTNEDMVGYWANDIISVEKEIPEGYKQLKINFKEER
jgi:hypothetical protein